MGIGLSSNQKLQELLAGKVKSIKADYAEIRAEELFSTLVSFRGVEPEGISEPYAAGFFIRVLINGSWGIVSCSDISRLDEEIKLAQHLAVLQGKGKIKLAKPSNERASIIPVVKNDFRKVPLKNKVTLVKKYNNLILKGDKSVQSSNIIYADNYLTKYFVNSSGAQILQVRPYIRLVYQAVGRTNGVIEMYRGSTGHIGGYEIVEGLEDEMIDVAKSAVELSRAPKVKGGNYTVILDPLMAGTFAHEAFGHLSEADFQYESPKLMSQMKNGREIGSTKVTIVDDPNLENGWGNFVYDDEGVKAQKVVLMKNGIISGRFHSLETAAKMGEQPNGRARAGGFSSQPIVRMSNTFFERGKEKLEDLISSTGHGILAVSWLGGMTAMENFTFTALYGVMIENGKLTTKVRGVKLMGNVFQTLKNVDGVTDDFATDQGTCGKMGQGMQVGSGGPYVRINNVKVGGD